MPPAISQKDIAQLVKMAIRPTDQIVRFDSRAYLVVLPGLNVDAFSRIVETTQDHLRQQFQSLPVPVGASRIGGVMVIPAGRKPATSDTLLSALTNSTKQSQTSTAGISMLAVIGKKIQPLTA